MLQALRRGRQRHWRNNCRDGFGDRIMDYILGIDQSTQGTKLLLFDRNGAIAGKTDRSHRQLISEQGWVSHDLNEIYQNLLEALQELLRKTGIDGSQIKAVGISNQRETTCAFDQQGLPFAKAIVWQCGRAAEIASRHADKAELIFGKTGLKLSPYFPAAKMQWFLENELQDIEPEKIRLGTVDTWLICRLTHGAVYKTDATNASRTQLYDIRRGQWDEELMDIFHVRPSMLPEVTDSNGDFGMTDFDGILPAAVPITAAIGDSHAALFGQNCRTEGMIKATYGTGSSIMMNIGDKMVSDPRLSTSIAYQMDGRTFYCLEGNINYTGAVISWLKNDLQLISSPGETEDLIARANPGDQTVLVPAFTGLSAPHWNTEVRAAIMNMSRTTGRGEIVKAAVDSIAQQVTDVIEVMKEVSGHPVKCLRVDGGPTRNHYLMKLQSLLAECSLDVPDREELSAIGAAYMAGMKAGIYSDEVYDNLHYQHYRSETNEKRRQQMRRGWKAALTGAEQCAKAL